MIVDLFAGPGGWDLGARELNLDPVGVEHDPAANETAEAAGFTRIHADVSTLDPADFGSVSGLIASPPCQAWSSVGDRLGEFDRGACHDQVDRYAAGNDATDWRVWADPRSPLVAEPVRWARDRRPLWIALEEVPQVLGLWHHVGRVLERWGYSTWTGILNAADYGVPQTRRRAILVASRARRVTRPAPTHAEHPAHDLWGDVLKPWVTIREALPELEEGLRFYAAGVSGQGRPKSSRRPADTLTSKGTAYWVLDHGQNPERTRLRPLDEPAPTVVCSRPGNLRWRQGALSRRVTPQEAGVLQTFPAAYPWRGSTQSQYQQIGNAVPPLLARAVLSMAAGR